MRQKNLRRRLPRRWPMIRLTDALTVLTPKTKKSCNVVIFRMFGIGDALLFRAVLEKHAEVLNVPLDEITVLGSTSWSVAADLFFRDVEVFMIDERRFARNFFYRLRIMRRLRQRGFKTAICGMRFRYPHVIESLMLASGASVRIVAEARANEKFDAMFEHYSKRMTRVISIAEPDGPRAGDGQPLPLMHEIEHQLAFLSAVAGKPITLTALPKLTLVEKPAPLMQAGEAYAVLNIGASHAPRRWPLKHYFEIARRLMEQGISVVVLGGPSERNLKAEIEGIKIEGTGTGRIIVSIDELDFASAAQLVNHASMIISNDTGIGHLAVMLHRPSVLLVGGGHFGSFMPYPSELTPERVRFLYHPMPCYHCNWNCTMMQKGDNIFPCVEQIAVEDVWQAALDVLGKSAVTTGS